MQFTTCSLTAAPTHCPVPIIDDGTDGAGNATTDNAGNATTDDKGNATTCMPIPCNPDTLDNCCETRVLCATVKTCSNGLIENAPSTFYCADTGCEASIEDCCETTSTDSPTNSPTMDPTNRPSSKPSSSPTTVPTIVPTGPPSEAPTISPTTREDCVVTEEWTQDRADELCPNEDHHAYDVGVCDKWDNPDFRIRLNFALANQLYTKCSSPCLYDYDTYNSTLPHAFRWISSSECYNVATGYYCINDESEAMKSVHEYSATLCVADDQADEDSCIERVEWSKEIAESNCPNGFGSGGDKGWGTAKICEDIVRLDSGYFENAADLYSASFNLTLANHIFWSCSSTCMYDLVYPGEIVYNWKKSKDCWAMQTKYSCVTDHAREYDWAVEYIEDDICADSEATPAPVPFTCTDRVQDWTEQIALATCGSDDMGSTDKSSTAVVCDGYENYQYRLDNSLANRVFLRCSAWCVYDIHTNAQEAFIWRNNNQCWEPVTSGLCIQQNVDDREEMANYIETILCESTTPEPTKACMPNYSWDNDRAKELCTDYGSTDKGFGVNVCADTPSNQDNLERSLANRFYANCASWCVYDYDVVINNILTNSSNTGGFIWKSDCWKWVTDYYCFNAAASEFEKVLLFAKDHCAVQ